MMAIAILTITPTVTMAKKEQKQVLNPWGLVYDGALAENVAGGVNIHPVTYEVGGVSVSANVYTPAGRSRFYSHCLRCPLAGAERRTAARHRQTGQPYRRHPRYD